MVASITEFRDACGAVTKHLHARYGVSVEVASIKPPLKGDLDGSRILVADHNTDEERLFLVAHLFGHTVQWNISAELRRLGMTMGPPAANIMDFAPMTNIPTFGMCMSPANPMVAAATAAALGVLTPMPCIPVTTPWTPGAPMVLVRNFPALDAASKCMCGYGGQISITTTQVKADVG